MFAKLFFLFALLPIIEIALLINVGEQIGGWNTVALVIITAFFGAHLVRQEGLSTLMTAQQKLQAGEVPGQQMAEGLLLVVAGVLLVTPGFITDAIGFLFSLPFTRPAIARSLMKQFGSKIVVSGGAGHAQFHQSWHQTRSYQQSPQRRGDGGVFEGEYVRTDKSDGKHLGDTNEKSEP